MGEVHTYCDQIGLLDFLVISAERGQVWSPGKMTLLSFMKSPHDWVNLIFF